MDALLGLLLAAGIGCLTTLAHAQQATWEAPYRGDDPELLYLPDTKATYWRYGWIRESGDRTGIIIRGKTPDARYFSYNVYDDNIKSSVGSYTDFEIASNDGTPNPFSGKGSGAHSNYTILVLPKGTKTDAKNVLYFPDDLTKVSVFLRNYVAKNTIEGNVPMPTVEIYDPDAKKASPAPPSSIVPALSKQEVKKYLVPMLTHIIDEFEKSPEIALEKLHLPRNGEPIDIKELIATQVVSKAFTLFKAGARQYSLRLQTAGTYPNQDNYYLGLPIIRTKGQALLARFKTPKIPRSTAEYPNAEVRYFSLSQGDKHSFTHGTIMDTEMKVDSDGFANFIIADKTPEMAAKAKELGVNFMPWLAGDKMLLIYRHMLPATDFAHGIDKVASFDHKKPVADQIAIKTIGAYALIGKLVNSNSISEMSEFPKL